MESNNTLGDSASATVVTLPDTAAKKEGRLEIPITVARGKATVNGIVRTKDGRPLGEDHVQDTVMGQVAKSVFDGDPSCSSSSPRSAPTPSRSSSCAAARCVSPEPGRQSRSANLPGGLRTAGRRCREC